jgi:hypothetical protein
MIIDTPEGIQAFHMLAQYHALKLEIKGLKHSRGSVYAHIKRVYGLKGNKQRVLDQFEQMLKDKGMIR